MTLLNFQNLSYGFSELLLFEKLDAEVEQGKMIAIVGLNGTGKTTLLRILAGYLQPLSGLVNCLGKPLKDMTDLERAKSIAVVPQDIYSDFPFTVEQFVLMGRSPWQTSFSFSKNDYQKVHEALSKWRLEDFKDRELKTLSGGERQRALLARAFVQETPLLLLDEPLNHLDIKNTYEVLSDLKHQVQNLSKTVVAILHQVHLIPDFFDEVWGLKERSLFKFSGQNFTDSKKWFEFFEVDQELFGQKFVS